MSHEPLSISLVEQKKFDDKKAHAVVAGIWWVGLIDDHTACSQNPYLLLDNDESVLINPGSRSDEHYRIIRSKVASIIKPSRIDHIVLLHHDPGRCAATPLFENKARTGVHIYAPARVAASIKYYGCKQPVISLDDSDGIILKSGRTLTYYDTPNLEFAGSGFLHDPVTHTVFTGNIFNCLPGEWNLFAPANGWENLAPFESLGAASKKAYHLALNKIERLSPERICPNRGPIIEDNIDKYLAAARNIDSTQKSK